MQASTQSITRLIARTVALTAGFVWRREEVDPRYHHHMHRRKIRHACAQACTHTTMRMIARTAALMAGSIRRREEVERMSVRELRELLGSRGISTLGFLEKRDFLDAALASGQP